MSCHVICDDIGPSQEVPLFPVPIGTTQADAPVQYTELVNPTEIDLQYEVRRRLRLKNLVY